MRAAAGPSPIGPSIRPSIGWSVASRHRLSTEQPASFPSSLVRTGSATAQKFTMNAIRTLIALSVATLAAACASPGVMNAAPASPGMSGMTAPAPMAAMQPRMKAMQEMHQKMMGANSPEAHQAMMADHMKAMQDGMAMMKEMHGGMQIGRAHV